MVKKLLLIALVLGACSVWSVNDIEAGASDVTGVVNINTAGIEELSMLPFIGPAKAKQIINHRSQNGQFQKVEDIMSVKGIGEKTFLKIKNHLSVTGETTIKTL